jgi:hypothetical protein
MKLSKEERSHWTKEQKRLYKQYGYLPEIQQKNEETISHSNDILTILCVRFGKRYGREYVEKLRNMVSRNLTLPYQFFCLTDDSDPIENVKSIVVPNAGYQKGWWHKVHMFDPSLGLQGRILYFDLDVIVHGNIEKLIKIGHNDFYGIKDFNRKFHPDWNYLNSSVMSWRAGTQNHIWEKFVEEPKVAMRLHGDQDWIWKVSKERIKFWPKEWIQSYKWEIRSKNDLSVNFGIRKFRERKDDVEIDPRCCVTVFHGDPKPPDIQDKFVVDNWK